MPEFHLFANWQREQARRQRRRCWLMIAGGAGVLCLLLATGWPFGFWPKKAENVVPAGQKNLLQQAGQLRETVSWLPQALGYDQPKNYLVLFLNNTEIRPGGGFIGSYGLVRLEQGRVTEFETNGSENLDFDAPKSFQVEAPEPIRLYLKQSRWLFRDSNWSPDFPTSAGQSLWFYRQEGGKSGSDIDGVIGITPTVVAELVKLTGPVTVGGKTFDAAGFTQELEYHVEYGFRKESQDLAQRKAILNDLGQALLKKLESLAPWRWKTLWDLFMRLSIERQIMFYSQEAELEQWLTAQNWAGEVKNPAGDYLLIVNSNLASLKSDPAVKKSIHYELRQEAGKWRAKVTAAYDHRGQFDWKTTRYRTYTRLYAPAGSQLISSSGFIKNQQPARAEESQELGKTVWGGFISIEPQEKKSLVWEYYLPNSIGQMIDGGLYTLFVQKQLGEPATGLTLDLNFDKKIKNTGATVYHLSTDLTRDRDIELSF